MSASVPNALSLPVPATDLNAPQLAAVEHFEGPLLVLAGPGSGKTRVITRRIARLIERGVDPWRILAITFTNKAAKEMEHRVQSLLPEAGGKVWVSTFHKMCARLLRKYAQAVGLQPNFSIFDTADQRQIMKGVCNELEIDTAHYSPAGMLHRISEAKQKMLTPEQFDLDVNERGASFNDLIIAKVYTRYQQQLMQSNAVDFDDLLVHIARLLVENDEIRSTLDNRFRFVLVDEYQDTNLVQYRIVQALSQDYPNLCATGDPDQSIYGWRGAQIENILRFERDFPRASIVRLEQNYRSTQAILSGAGALISRNERRKHKELFSDIGEGHPPTLVTFQDQREEADGLARMILHLHKQENRPWSDFAITYRTNALSRGLELAFVRHGIPYQVAAGVAFYDRSEIKDLMAYLRLIHNPSDEAAFQRVVNTPPRGIGLKSLRKARDWANRNGTSSLEAAAVADTIPGIPKKGAYCLKRFATLMQELTQAAGGGVTELLRTVLSKTYYREMFGNSSSDDDQQRVANIDEMLTATEQYDRLNPEDASLEGFLETAGLAADVDSVDEAAGKVTLLTLHSAKGLEFPVVVVLAVEHNILPHQRSMDQYEGIEEERRLLFVGMTRARERLYLTRAETREFRGSRGTTIESSFLREIGPSLKYIDARDLDFWDASAAAALREPPPETMSTRRAEAARRAMNGIPLTTGAALLAGTAEPASIPQMFRPGMLVRHPRYGLGSVLNVSGEGKHRTLMVQFEDSEPVSFLASKSHLQPVGRG